MLAKDGIRKVRLHDLRHTFGSLLIQAGASIVYVKEQMGHSSIQVTVDIYDRTSSLVPSVSYVDRLDVGPGGNAANIRKQDANAAIVTSSRFLPKLLI